MGPALFHPIPRPTLPQSSLYSGARIVPPHPPPHSPTELPVQCGPHCSTPSPAPLSRRAPCTMGTESLTRR